MDGRPPPNLTDPAERDAHRRELRGVVRGVRRGGIALAVLGAVIAALRAWVWPAIPALLPMMTVALAVMLMLTAIAFRNAYHVRRMRGE